MISDPFRLLDCSLESDGGAAVVVSSAQRSRPMSQRAVYISGCAQGHPDSPGSITQRPDLNHLGLAKAARRAFQMAEVEPKDIQVTQLYDCFTYVVISQLEALGFCGKGEGGPFVEGGRLHLGGIDRFDQHLALDEQSPYRARFRESFFHQYLQ